MSPGGTPDISLLRLTNDAFTVAARWAMRRDGALRPRGVEALAFIRQKLPAFVIKT
jgi:hypothetical protein